MDTENPGGHREYPGGDREYDDERVRACLEQERFQEAFELLLTHYDGKVFRMAYAILGNRSLAEETSQDIFMRIWRALPHYRGDAMVSTWVFAIARNTCLTALKSARLRSTVSLDEPATRGAVESRFAPAQNQRPGPDVMALVQKLPQKYRQVILLYYMEEKSYEQVSRELDLPIGTVRSYLHRGKKVLAAAFREAQAGKGRS